MYVEYKDLLENIEQTVSRSLSGSDYDRGAVEEANATADNISDAFGKLASILVTKKLLSIEEVADICEIYIPKEGSK